MNKPVILTENTDADLKVFVESLKASAVVLLTDKNVENLVLPLFPFLASLPRVVVEAGEHAKSIASATEIWSALEKNGANRRSVLVNLGGGMVTDLGGFAASTFKRGIRFVNVATTILAAVDASVGGKTGVNFNGLKNEIGLFAWPEATFVSLDSFSTLPKMEILSGLGEILKCHFIGNSEELKAIPGLTAGVVAGDIESTRKAVEACVALKQEVVAADPKEAGLRRILNFGHTMGHAIESLSHSEAGVRAVPHGIAVAYGILFALQLSEQTLGLSTDVSRKYYELLVKRYPSITDFYPENILTDCGGKFLKLMQSDKKNTDRGSINFTLLESVGKAEHSVAIDVDNLRPSIDAFLKCIV